MNQRTETKANKEKEKKYKKTIFPKDVFVIDFTLPPLKAFSSLANKTYKTIHKLKTHFYFVYKFKIFAIMCNF